MRFTFLTLAVLVGVSSATPTPLKVKAEGVTTKPVTPAFTPLAAATNPLLVMWAGQLCEGDSITVDLSTVASDQCLNPNYSFLSALVQYGSGQVALPYRVDIITDCDLGTTVENSYTCYSYDDPTDPYNTYDRA